MSAADAVLIDALPAVRAGFLGWCGSLVAGRAFWVSTPTAGIARPLIIIQSQDDGGSALAYVGSRGWSGLVTVRCLTNAGSGGLAAAETLARQVAAAVPASVTLTVGAATFAASLQLLGPVSVPPVNDTWTAALRYRVQLHLP